MRDEGLPLRAAPLRPGRLPIFLRSSSKPATQFAESPTKRCPVELRRPRTDGVHPVHPPPRQQVANEMLTARRMTAPVVGEDKQGEFFSMAFLSVHPQGSEYLTLGLGDHLQAPG